MHIIWECQVFYIHCCHTRACCLHIIKPTCTIKNRNESAQLICFFVIDQHGSEVSMPRLKLTYNRTKAHNYSTIHYRPNQKYSVRPNTPLGGGNKGHYKIPDDMMVGISKMQLHSILLSLNRIFVRIIRLSLIVVMQPPVKVSAQCFKETIINRHLNTVSFLSVKKLIY